MNNKITLTLPPSEQWLTMINENVRHYAKLHKFIKHPEDDLTQSLLEACEAFLLMAHKVGISDDYEVSFDFHNDAIVLGLVYNGKIPLNPHETEDYEVPESEADLDKINLDVDTAIPLGLITNELATNAYKYAFTDHAEGRIEIEFRKNPDHQCMLRISDNGTGLPPGIDPGNSPSLGLKLVNILAKQIMAKLNFSNESGTTIKISFSLNTSE